MVQLFTQTDKNIIPDLPRYTFEGRIVVVQSEGEAERAVKYLRQSKILGIDTETRPSFKRGIQYQVALLQIANDEICFLFRLNYMGFPQCLVDLLEDPTILKIGLSLHDDFRMLGHRHEDFHPKGFVDLQHLAAGMGILDMSLQKLFANVFHQRISKNAQLSNWEADHLDEKQRVYAATDADACIQLYRVMSDLHATGDYELIPVPKPEPVEPTPADNAEEKVEPVSEVKEEKKEKAPAKKRTRKPATPKATKEVKTKKTTKTAEKKTTKSSEKKTAEKKTAKTAEKKTTKPAEKKTNPRKSKATKTTKTE